MGDYLEPQIKIETLRRLVEECDKHSIPALKNALINFAWNTWGTTSRTAKEYLRILVQNKEIVIDNEYIWLFKRFEKIRIAQMNDYLHMKDLIRGSLDASQMPLLH